MALGAARRAVVRSPVTFGFALLGLSHGSSALPVLWVLVAFTVAMKGAEYALAKPARETLYTVVDRETRYKSKAFIDTFVYRGGDAATAMVYKSLGALGVATVAYLMVPVALLWTGAAWSLGRRQQERVRRAAASGSGDRPT